jgi:hypothetical protein
VQFIKKNLHSELWTLWHRNFIFNSNKSPTWCNNFSVYYPDVCLQLNMFSRPSSGAQWLQWLPLVLPSYRSDSRAVFVVGPDYECLLTTNVHGATTGRKHYTPEWPFLLFSCHLRHTSWQVLLVGDKDMANCLHIPRHTATQPYYHFIHTTK